MVDDGVLVQSRLHLVGQRTAFGSEGLIAVDGLQNLGGLTQGAHGKEVGGNQEVVGCRIVGRTERRSNQATRLDGRTHTVAALGVELALGTALEGIRAETIKALLLLEGFERQLNGGKPRSAEHARISRFLPIGVGQSDGIAVGIDFPFSFVHLGTHIRLVGHPLPARRPVVEGVGIGVERDEFELLVDDTGNQQAQRLVFSAQADIGPHLGTGIAQPHRMDITRIDKGLGRAVAVFPEMHRGIQGVGEAIAEHPGQGRVGQLGLHLNDGLLHGLGGKQTVLLSRTPASIITRGLGVNQRLRHFHR